METKLPSGNILITHQYPEGTLSFILVTTGLSISIEILENPFERNTIEWIKRENINAEVIKSFS